MKILVIEDKQMHQESAQQTLVGHDVTIVSSYDEAVKLMNKNYYPSSASNFNFDAVLTDMNLPMSHQTLVPEAFSVDEQVPYGFVLALMAANCGAKYVAMVTDTNHHKGAMSAALDNLSPTYYAWYHDSTYESEKPKVFNVNGAKVVFVHTPFVKDYVKDQPCTWCKENPGVCQFCKGTGVRTDLGNKEGQPCNSCTRGTVGVCENCRGTLKYDMEVKVRKDWGQVLRDLTKEEKN